MTVQTTHPTGEARPSDPGPLPTSDAAAGPRQRGDFPALDGLRIVAVTAVVATHAAYSTGHYSRGAARGLLSHLDVGVAVFFVISGFLISREWLTPARAASATGAGRAGGGLPSYRTYLRRRALRILPMYWVAALIALLAVPANRGRGVGDWLSNLFLVQVYGGEHLLSGFTQAWSLSTEVLFYLLLPGFAWVVARLARRRAAVPMVTLAAAALLGAVSIAWVVYYHADGRPWVVTAGYWLPTNLSWFLAGTALAAIRQGADAPAASRRRPGERGWTWRALDAVGDSPGVCVLVGLCAFTVAATPLSGDPQDPLTSPGQAVAQRLLYLVAAVALVAPAVLGGGRVYDAVLGHPVLRYLGRISYSVFLLHLMVLPVVTHLLGQAVFTGRTLPTFALTWVLTLPLAALGYHLVERPLTRWGRRVSPRRPVAPVTRG